jgi:hypothetical protein
MHSSGEIARLDRSMIPAAQLMPGTALNALDSDRCLIYAALRGDSIRLVVCREVQSSMTLIEPRALAMAIQPRCIRLALLGRRSNPVARHLAAWPNGFPFCLQTSEGQHTIN